MRPAHFNRVLAQVKGEPAEALVNEVVLRAQSQAEYTHENYGHFGLNLRRYAHFTSPIRRYADLVVHRALIRALKLGAGGLDETGAGELADVAERISGGRAARDGGRARDHGPADRRASGRPDRRAVRGAHRRRHQGRAVRQACATPAPTASSPPASLGADYFRFDEASRALVGTRTGETFRLGDSVEVQAAGGGAVRRRAAVRDADARAARAAPRARRSAGDDRGNVDDAARRRRRAPARARDAPRLPRPLPALRRGAAVSRLSQGRRRLPGLRRGPHPSARRRRAGLFHHPDRRPFHRRRRRRRRGHLAELAVLLDAFVWAAVAAAASLLLLPRVKGALVGYQWAMRMHGFGGPARERA